MKKFLYSLMLLALIAWALPVNSYAVLFRGSGLTTNADTTNPVLTVNCVNGDDSRPCTTYTTTNAGKIGTIKVNINGTTGYIDVKRNPV